MKKTLATPLWVLLALAGAGCSHQPFTFLDGNAPDAGMDASAHEGTHPDAGSDAAVAHEGGAPVDSAAQTDASVMRDASVTLDASIVADAGLDAAVDAGHLDAGDGGPTLDAGDGGPTLDAGDGGPTLDAGDGGPTLDASSDPDPTEVPENLRLAFFGDQGSGVDAEAVLQLVKDEGADLLIHAGDLDYLSQPLDWDAQVTRVLGPDFPYFVAIGNHDVSAWLGPDGYQALIAARLARVPDAQCTGDIGVNSMCTFRGLAMVLSGVGTYGEDSEAYLASALAAAPQAWKLCSWHKNQRDMQVGAKDDEVGWRAYRLCEGAGALILTGHEHSYSRTYTLSAVGYPEIEHGFHGAPDRVALEPGSTAVVVAGLGGMSTRAFVPELHPDISWWASIYARNYQLMNGVETGVLDTIEFGALFIDFHVDGDPYKARAYFKTVSGAIVDSFEITVTP